MDQLTNSFHQQISELNLLLSMYPNDGEITIADKTILSAMTKFIDSESEFIPNRLEYVINLTVNKLKLEICANLPSTYPNEGPDINVRCNSLNRHQESSLNTKLSVYIDTVQNGEVCLYSAIAWIQDNIDVFAAIEVDEPCSKSGALCSLKIEQFTRFWIYSHHIYDKKKREEITKKAKELQLTGFCLPGKPGVICIEGNETACKDWWHDIKSLNWKKIVLKKVETFQPSEMVANKKFYCFEELHFPASAKRSNMSEFSMFMHRQFLGDIFKELFGFNE